jgi:ABC-type multidrug transport system permease subunit
MAVTGLIVGWGIHTSFWEAAAGFGLLLLFAYAISWMMATVGLSVSSVEVVNNASFLVIFPLTFISNAFVPITNFPPVLKTFAEWNPVSAVTQAVRELFGNTNPLAPVPDAWPLQNALLASLIWIVVILAIFIPFAISRFKKAAAR